MWVCVRGKHSFTADVRKADWCTFLFSFLCWFLSLLLLLPSLAVPSSLSAVWVWRGQMSCYVRGNAAVREVKLYFSLKGVFFSCQQAWLHPWLPLPISIFSLYFCFFLSSFASLSLPLSFSLPASYLELYRGQIEGIIFLRLNFSAMQWYWRSHSAPVSKINQKHFSTAAINALAAFQPLCLFPISDTFADMCTLLRHTSTLFLFCVSSWGGGSLLNADIR